MGKTDGRERRGPMALSSFLRINPPSFGGTTNSSAAEKWIRGIERALRVQHIPDDQLVEFGTYKLEGDALFWWHGVYGRLSPGEEVITWETFRTKFYKKYLPGSAQVTREVELLHQKQGSMSVAEYTSQFEDIYRFSKGCTEEWKCRKYEGGLREEIYVVVRAMEPDTYAEVVNKAQLVERSNEKLTVAGGSCRDPYSANQERNLAPRGQDFKRVGKSQQTHGAQIDLPCPRCHRRHPDTPCRAGMNVCFTCGAPGHVKKDCRSGVSQPNSGFQQPQKSQTDLNCPRCGKRHPNRPCRAGKNVCYVCGKPGHLARSCRFAKKQDGSQT